MSARRAIAAVVSLAALAGAAEAQFNVNPTAPRRSGPGRLQVSGFIGSQSFDHSLGSVTNIYQTVSGEAQNIGFGKLYGLRASWGFTRNLTAEFNVSAGRNKYVMTIDDIEVGRVGLGEQFETTELNLGGNLVLEFPLATRMIVPYVTGGAGLQRSTPQNRISGIDRSSSFDFNAGGGIKVWLNAPQWLGFRVDGRYHSASDGITFPGGSSSPKGFELTVGAALRVF